MPEGGTKTALDASRMRDPNDAGGYYSPGEPPVPQSNQPVRVIDFPSGYNIQYQPRAYEPFTFADLRSFSNTEIVRLAIETRKDQIERLDYFIKPRDPRRRRSDAADRIRKVEKLLRRPDGATDFSAWLRPLLEDLLTIDAPCMERRFNRGGDLIALDLVDGATIRVLVDHTGRRPLYPNPAYQQIIKGTVWADLTTRDIIYAPRNIRSNHLYGFSQVEQVIVTINTLLRRQGQQLAYFTDGNIPQGLVTAPEGWTPDQIKEYQSWVDSQLSGNLKERSKLLWAPAGSVYKSFKEAPLKDEFDEWLARVICYCFSIPPTPFIKSMNKGTAQEDQDRAMEEGLSPLLIWVKRVFDGVIQDDFGFNDLEFSWNLAPDLDPAKLATINDISLKNGTMCINEVRESQGREPIPGGDKHYIYTGNGAIPVERLDDMAELDRQLKEVQVKNANQPKESDSGGNKNAEPAPRRTTKEPSDREQQA